MLSMNGQKNLKKFFIILLYDLESFATQSTEMGYISNLILTMR